MLGGETICIDRKHAQAWIDLRNRSYHPDGSVAGKKYITMETAVTQLMETCQNILLFMMKGMLEKLVNKRNMMIIGEYEKDVVW